MIFKKHTKPAKDGHHHHSTDLKFRPDIILDTKDEHSSSGSGGDDKKWKPFENIKIYTDRRKLQESIDPMGAYKQRSGNDGKYFFVFFF